MFEHRPSEPEWRSWTWVILWSLSIFASIPLARSVEAWVREHLGQHAFGWFVVGVVVASAALAVIAVVRAGARAPVQRRRGSLAWLIGIALVFVVSTATLWSNPEEAMHFVQYGGLGALLHRAFAHRLADRSIYLIAGLGGALIGCLDEAIQWITPMRYFGMRDIGLNGYASVLVQLAIAKGIDPAWIEPSFSTRGLQVVVRAAALLWTLLLVFTLNTPARVDAYASSVVWLQPLADNPSTMVEYGHRYRDPEIGVFPSRLSPEALRLSDEEQGPEVGGLVAGWSGSYDDFLASHPPHREPYAHEFRVHLFRRDANIGRYGRSGDEAARRRYALIAVREDLILRRYFSQALEACGCALGPERQELERVAPRSADYESPVSGGLVTWAHEWQLLLGFAAGFAALLALERRLSASRT